MYTDLGISLLSFVLCTQCARDYCIQQKYKLCPLWSVIVFARQRLNKIKHKLMTVLNVVSELKHCRIQKKGFEEERGESYCMSLVLQQLLFDRVAFGQRFEHNEVEARELLRRGKRSRSARQDGLVLWDFPK